MAKQSSPISGIAVAAVAVCYLALPVLANPNGAQVASGSATVAGQGTTTVTVNQASQKTILNWDSFSIDPGETTHFVQPNANAVALNRVTGGSPSLIYGSLTANGKLILINPNGMTVGPSGIVSANSFIATTANISDDNFLAGNLTFDIPGNAKARIVNEGTITVGQSGLAAFVAPSVKNSGLIQAKLGTVTLGAATKFTLDFYGDQLVSFPIDAAVTQAPTEAKALIEAGGRIEATNIVLTAQAARDVINDVIVADGELIARSAQVIDGKIRLGTANASQELDGATGATRSDTATGPTIVLDGGTNGRVMISGLADASGEQGGTISIKGEQSHITGSVIAQGSTGAGGTISVSGTRFVSFGGLLSADGLTGGAIIASSTLGDFSLGGIATARGLVGDGGSIDIAVFGESWEFGGSVLDVSSATNGGSIRHVAGDKLITSANYFASGLTGIGGNIDVTAGNMFLLSSTYDASGNTGGGRVRLGGEYQGGKSLTTDELLNSRTLTANDGVKIDVSARGNHGSGGSAIIWSDEKTTFLGSADARGGLISGTGGLVEASSFEQLIWRGTVETAREGLRGGTLLLDPKNLTIADGNADPLALILRAFAYNNETEASGTGDNFGASVSLDGTRLAVGRIRDDGAGDSCLDCGAVYLFTFTDSVFSGGMLASRIGDGYTGGNNINLAGTLGAFDLFGLAVSLDGTRLAVGAYHDEGAANSCTDCGAVYLFTFADSAFSGGTLAARIGDGYTGGNNINLAGTLGALDLFGNGVSLDGTRLAVGALRDGGATDSCEMCGAVYLFTFTDSTFSGGTLTARIGDGYTGGNDINLAGTLGAFDLFGVAVSLDGTRLAVGTYGDEGAANSCTDCGAVYLFTFADSAFSGGTLAARIGDGYTGGNNINLAGTLGALDLFGSGVSLDGTRLAVGAYWDDGATNSCSGCGAVYLYTFTDSVFSGGTLTARIGDGYTGGNNINLAGTLGAFDLFGYNVSLDGARLAVGAVLDDGATNNCSDCGAVYLFGVGGSGGGGIGSPLFGSNPGADQTIFASTLTTILNAGTNVVLQANNDITILADIFVNNPLGTGGDLTLQAGRSVFFNADIETDGGDLTVIANDAPSSGVIGAHRDPGAAEIFMASGASIDTSCKPVASCYGDVRLTIGPDTLKTNHATGDITLQSIVAGTLIAENLGSSGGDVVIRNQIDAFDTGPAVILASLTGDFRNLNSPLGQTILSTPNGHWLIYNQSHGQSLFGPLLGRQRNNVTYNPNAPAGAFSSPPPSPFDGFLLFRSSPGEGRVLPWNEFGEPMCLAAVAASIACGPSPWLGWNTAGTTPMVISQSDSRDFLEALDLLTTLFEQSTETILGLKEYLKQLKGIRAALKKLEASALVKDLGGLTKIAKALEVLGNAITVLEAALHVRDGVSAFQIGNEEAFVNSMVSAERVLYVAMGTLSLAAGGTYAATFAALIPHAGPFIAVALPAAGALTGYFVSGPFFDAAIRSAREESWRQNFNVLKGGGP